MDQNILMTIAKYIDPVSFNNYIKALPFLLKSCHFFGLIYSNDIVIHENQRFNITLTVNILSKIHSIYQRPEITDISLLERIINSVKKFKCDSFHIGYLSDNRLQISFINVNHDSFFEKLRILKNKKSIKCRNPEIRLWVSDYKYVQDNSFFKKQTAKIIILKIEKNKISIPFSNVSTHEDYLNIKL